MCSPEWRIPPACFNKRGSKKADASVRPAVSLDGRFGPEPFLKAFCRLRKNRERKLRHRAKLRRAKETFISEVKQRDVRLRHLEDEVQLSKSLREKVGARTHPHTDLFWFLQSPNLSTPLEGLWGKAPQALEPNVKLWNPNPVFPPKR